MKKVLSLVLVLTMVLGSFSMAFAAPNDVVGTEYEDAVERLIQLGVFTGYPDGTFKPANTITRSEFAAAVVRLKGLDAAAQASTGATGFADIPVGNWSSGYVNIASKLGLVNGYPNGNFGLNDPITYEQAVTIIMRVLGYEKAAVDRGGYPFGYLIMATQIGLTDGVKGVQGLPAPRGLVAQLMDGALTQPMMIQVGFGSSEKWVISGTEGTEKEFLFDSLGFTRVSKERVVDINPAKNQIKFEKEGLVKVADGFDFEEVYGLRLTAWLDGNGKLVLFDKVDAPKYDAVVKGEKLTLVSENKKFVVADKATLLLNGKEKAATDFTADYAKVVLNSDDEIVWADGYTWDASYVVEEIKEDVVYSYGDELDVAKFTIVKEGKTIKAEDLEEGDILFFNEAAKYAEVYNDSITGEISRVYVDSFRIDGDDYDIEGISTYLDGNYEYALDDAALRAMQEEGEVTVFFTRDGLVRFVSGDLGEEETSTVAIYLTENIVRDPDARGNYKYYLDGVNQNGGKVSEVLSHSIMLDTVTAETKAGYTDAAWKALSPADQKAAKEEVLDTKFDNALVDTSLSAKEGTIVTVEVDEEGDITAFTFPGTYKDDHTEDVTLDAKYIASKRLSSSLVVFDTTGTSVKATTWGELKGFDEVKKADVYYNENGYVTYLVIIETSEKQEKVEVSAVITDYRKVSGKNEWRVSAYVGNEEVEYVTATGVNDPNVVAGDIVKLEIDKNSGKLLSVKSADFGPTDGAVTVVSTRTNEVTVAGDVYKLVSDGAVIDVTSTSAIKVSSLRTLNTMLETNHVTATVVLDAVNSNFAKLVVITKGAAKTSDDGPTDFALEYNSTTGKITATLKDATKYAEYVVVVGDTAYTLDASGIVDTSSLLSGKIFKAELVKLDDIETVLASKTFVAK